MSIDPIRQSILRMATNKSALVIGPLGNYPGFKEDGYRSWDFAFLQSICERVVGLDTDMALAAEARRDGFDIRHDDAETFAWADRFDVIFATDVIEHVGSPLALFRNAANHLTRHGRLVVETPNPWALEIATRSLVRGMAGNLDHTCWVDALNARELARRAGLVIEHIDHYTPTNAFLLSQRSRARVYRALGSLRQHWHSKVVTIAMLPRDAEPT